MKIGVIGLGSIGLRHAKNLLALGHEVHGYDPDKERGRLFQELGGDLAMSSYTSLNPNHSFFDVSKAFVVATPTKQHADNLNLGFRRKPVFVEKPLAHDPRAVEMPAHLITMVGNNLRFHSCVKKVREWMPRIGTPLWANFTLAQYNDKPAYLRDGVILNWGAHEVDLALYLLGPANVRSCVSGYVEEEVIADMTLLHANGCQTTVHLDYLTKAQHRAFMIVGTNGTLMCDFMRRSVVFFVEDDLYQPKALYHDPDGKLDDDYIEEMRAFVDRIEGKYALGATGAEGLACLEILLEARRMAGLT